MQLSTGDIPRCNCVLFHCISDDGHQALDDALSAQGLIHSMAVDTSANTIIASECIASSGSRVPMYRIFKYLQTSHYTYTYYVYGHILCTVYPHAYVHSDAYSTVCPLSCPAHARTQASALCAAPCQARAAAVDVALSQALAMTECSCALAHAKYLFSHL